MKRNRKINEGGGAGIQFNMDESLCYHIEFVYNKGKIENQKVTVDNDTLDITARGYDDGGSIEDVQIGIKHQNIDLLETVQYILRDYKMSDIFTYAGDSTELDDYLDSTPLLKGMDSLGIELKGEINDIHVDLSTMHFGGYIRGTFTVGDIIFSNEEYEVVNDTVELMIHGNDDEEYIVKLNGKEHRIYFDDVKVYLNITDDVEMYKDNYTKSTEYHSDIIYNTIPDILATEQFVEWYLDTFENDDYDDDDAFYESRGIVTSIKEFKRILEAKEKT